MTHLVCVCDDRWHKVLGATPTTEPTLDTSSAVRGHLWQVPALD